MLLKQNIKQGKQECFFLDISLGNSLLLNCLD